MPTRVGEKALLCPHTLHLRVERVARMFHLALWKSAQTLPYWGNEIQVKMKKIQLQALKTLKTPRSLVTNKHICVYVSSNVATGPGSSSGGALLLLQEAARIIYTQRPHDSVSRPFEFAHQGQRCCSNHEGAMMKRTREEQSCGR